MVAVILCGGPGARLWPLSRRQRTKPFLELPTGGTLFGQLAASLDHKDFDEIVIVAGAAQLEHCQGAIATAPASLPPVRYVVEPEGRGTAPALASALRLIDELHGPDAVFMMYPADQHVADRARLNQAVAQAAALAARGKIVVLGIEPRSPSTQYGYIRAGKAEDGGLPVASFIEKPDAGRAEKLLAAGDCYWNAGMFCATVATMQAEMGRHAPAVAKAAARLEPDSGQVWTIAEDAYRDFPVIMVDHAVAEKTQLGMVVPVACGWSDLGSFSDWFELVEADKRGNRQIGAAAPLLADASDVSVLSETDRIIAVANCAELAIVDLPDALLVAGKDSAASLRELVARLQRDGARAVDSPSVERRAWGGYRQLGYADGWQVKRIEVLPGKRLSLQSHRHRCENWVVAAGTIEVTIDETVRTLEQGESCFIPQGAKHRMANPGTEPAIVIEVQVGAYLGEDDIKRYEDDFGRA